MADVTDEIMPATAQDVEQAKLLVTIEDSEKFLGLKEGYDVSQLLQCYETSFLDRIKNKKTKDLKTLTDSKNILLRSQIEGQISENGRFDLTIPFEKICKDCSGTGELYKFFRKTVEVECRVCEGKGKLLVPCRSCHGTGRFVKQDKGLKINVVCKTCKADESKKIDGVYHVEVKCKKCKGKGTIRKVALDDKIKSTTFCKTCRGRGFEMPKKEVIPSNPVLSASLGEQIKTTIVKPENPKVLDESVPKVKEE